MRRQTRNKGHLTHSGTLISSIGPATAPVEFEIVNTDVGARTTDGSQQIVTAERNTGDNCNVGDLVKYVNIMIQCGTKTDDSAAGNGWLEWAVQWGKENDTPIPNTNIGTTFLGVLCNRMFPTNTLLTGFVPVGKNQANGTNIQIKMPKKCQYLQTGDVLRLWCYYRTSNATETGTSQMRLVTSYIYKAYS